MIQLRRGSTRSWRNNSTKLAAGQPGYDKEKHKIKVGDGKSSWSELPYVGGLSAREILDSEAAAKTKRNKDSEDLTLFTYGTEAPDSNTVGQVYLQEYDAEPEVDYIISSGVTGIWTYQVWKSGIAKCWGRITLETDIQTAFDNTWLYHNSTNMSSSTYPITFASAPSETATVQSPGGITWLASKTLNTTQASGTYNIVSPDKQSNRATYYISLQVEGFIAE
jgi:hypothetical protein